MSSPSSLKILGAASFRTFRCLWMLEELGRDYEHVAVQPRSKKLTPYNPLGKVPVLVEDDDFFLCESVAINTYLGENTSFVPSDKRERAKYNQLTLTILTEIDAQGLWIHRKHAALGQYFGEIPDAVTEAKRCFDAVQDKVMLPQLKWSKRQGDEYYLLGSTFTAVDILYVHCLDWAKAIGWISIVSDDTSATSTTILQEYWTRCRSRPAYQRVAAMRRAEVQKQHESQPKL